MLYEIFYQIDQINVKSADDDKFKFIHFKCDL